jgi:serine/threonine protein kinase
VLEWADQILLALAYLHGQVPPVIHRDIKPHNLKLTPQNQIMLLDFDLAGRVGNKPVSPGGAQGYTKSMRRWSRSRAAPPMGAAISTLWRRRCTTCWPGRPPAPALGRESARQAGMPDPLLPIHHLNPALPPVLSTILGKALAQEPGQRFAAADSMQLALGKIPAAAQALATLGDTIVLDDGPKNTATPAALGETIVLNRRPQRPRPVRGAPRRRPARTSAPARSAPSQPRLAGGAISSVRWRPTRAYSSGG